MTDTQTPAPADRTVESMSANQLASAIRGRAAYLRDIADRIERYADDVPRVPGNALRSYGTVVQDVVSTLVNALPNLNLTRLIDAATDADVARAKGE